MDHAEWEAKVKGMLRAEIKRRNLTYQQVVDRLAEIGVQETEANVRNKVARGKFTAVFMMQCLTALGVSTLHVDH